MPARRCCSRKHVLPLRRPRPWIAFPPGRGRTRPAACVPIYVGAHAAPAGKRMIELRNGSEEGLKTVGPAESRGPSGRGILRAERPPQSCPPSRAARGWTAAGPSAFDAGPSRAARPGSHGFRLQNPALQAGTCRPYALLDSSANTPATSPPGLRMSPTQHSRPVKVCGTAGSTRTSSLPPQGKPVWCPRIPRAFYEAVVSPAIAAGDAHLRYTAGILGAGSEVIRCDDALSRDHDCGPRCQIYLQPSDYERRKNKLEVLLHEAVPATFRGWPTTNTPGGRYVPIQILNMDEYFRSLTGAPVGQWSAAWRAQRDARRRRHHPCGPAASRVRHHADGLGATRRLRFVVSISAQRCAVLALSRFGCRG